MSSLQSITRDMINKKPSKNQDLQDKLALLESRLNKLTATFASDNLVILQDHSTNQKDSLPQPSEIKIELHTSLTPKSQLSPNVIAGCMIL